MVAYASIIRGVNPDLQTEHAAEASAPAAATFYDGRDYVATESVGHLLHQVMFAMRRDIELRMGDHGLTAAQWLPLWKLKLGVAGTAQELARQMNVDAGSMTRLLDRLEAKGLIERLRSSTDRRVVNLALTAAGEAVVEHVPQALADVNNSYLQGFSHVEWQQLKGLLRRMLANAPQTPADAAGPAAPSADAGLTTA